MVRRKFCYAILAVVVLLPTGSALARDDKPLARFETPLCPGVVGLTVETAEIVVDRIRENAQNAGLRLADAAKCEANLIVAFVDDGQDYLQRLARSNPRSFGDMLPADRRTLLAREGPARTLQLTQTMTRDGMPVVRRENLAQVPQTAMWMAHSRIYTATREDLTSSLVLIDRTAAAQTDLLALADYATMAGLAQQHPAVGQGGSILTLFEGDGTADRTNALTSGDGAFLASLYGSIANLPASAHLTPGTATRGESARSDQPQE